MVADSKLLVVDDEEVICRGCWRVFSRQGFEVQTTVDPAEGLSLATHNDYAAILLDVKMPTMDGVQFLEELRKTKPDVPVVLITGYPNIPDAAAAMRLGAADYVTKPFSPEEITKAVQNLLRHRDTSKKHPAAPEASEADQWLPATDEFQFFGESWFRRGQDGSVRVGAVLERSLAAGAEAIRLPALGDIVYQGLPLAGVTATGGGLRSVPAPVSGVVVAVNEALCRTPPALWEDPCGESWIACISPTRVEDDARHCALRHVILANTDKGSAEEQRRQLASLGCRVRVVGGWEDLAPHLRDSGYHVLVIDGASLGEHDPQLVRRINEASPSAKIVVVASPGSKWETAYREGKIFYYAVEPFADGEIVDILDSAFRPQSRPAPPPAARNDAPKLVSGFWITNHRGEKVRLLAAGRLLRLDEGLGRQIERKLRDRLYPIEPTLGTADVSPMKLLKAASACDRLLVLMAKDMGRLPGSLMCDAKGEQVSVSPEHAGKVTALVVQPGTSANGSLDFDSRTTAALAEHIVREMTPVQE